jgi:hypothetical protein
MARFCFFLVLVALCGPAYAAQAGIVYHALYDCGPGRNQFEVLGCSGNLCTLFYPKGNGGTGFKTTIDRESLSESIDGTYGGTRKPCTIAGTVVHAPANAELHPAAAPVKAMAYGGPIVAGRYECFTYSGGHLESALMENFSISGSGRYRDAGGHSGTYTTRGGITTFHGGGLNGMQASYIPGVPGSANPPHMQFHSPRGGSADECDGKG